MLPRVLRSRLAVGMEEEDVLEMAGCAARAERRVGEGIAVPNPNRSRYEHLVWTGGLPVVLMTAGTSASRQGAATVVWRRVAERRPTSSDCWRKRGFEGSKSDNNKGRVVWNAGGCELRGGRVSGECVGG